VLLTEVYAAGEAPIVAADGRALARALRVAGRSTRCSSTTWPRCPRPSLAHWRARRRGHHHGRRLDRRRAGQRWRLQMLETFAT
jgi:hypothetical protein